MLRIKLWPVLVYQGSHFWECLIKPKTDPDFKVIPDKDIVANHEFYLLILLTLDLIEAIEFRFC